MIDLFDDGPDIVIKPDSFTAGESARIFEQLKAQISWRQDVMRFGQREVLQRRLAAWYGDDGKTYVQYQITMIATVHQCARLARKSYESVQINQLPGKNRWLTRANESQILR